VKNRPLLPLTAGAAALLLAGLAGTPALAATAPTPAKGAATSSLSLISTLAGGHELAVGTVSLVSDTVAGSPLAKVTVTPLVVDGTAVGKQVITPANSPLVVPTATSPSALVDLVSLSSPALSAVATNGPTSRASADSLGSLSLLGMNIPLNGAVDLGSAVSSAGAVGEKALSLRDLSLPSIAAVLAALGLDVTKLPVGTLTTLVDELAITTTAIDTALGAVDTAQTAVDNAAAIAAAKAAELLAAQATEVTRQAAVTQATAALQALLDEVDPATVLLFAGANTVAGYATLVPAGITAVEVDAPGSAAAYTSLTSAQAALATATAAVATAQAAVNTAQAQVTALTATVTTLLGGVDALARTVLNGTPLVSLDSLVVSTKALVTSNKAGGQQAQIVGGSVGGLRVLGTDVLDTVLGSPEVDVVDLVGEAGAEVTDLMGEITGTLSDVLSNVPGLPALNVPAPEVGLLTKTTSTSISGGFGRALASIDGLSITIPPITMPTSVTLPDAVNLPALDGVTQVAGQLTSGPVGIDLLTVSEQSAFAPAVIAPTVTTGTPTLPRTGLPVGVTAFAVLLLVGAAVLHRRKAATA
jgi:hypothetical protein